MSQHTPGPWEVHDVNADCLLIRGDVPHSAEDRDYYRSIATVTQRNQHPRFGGGISHETCAANARLIAAAPELLEIVRLSIGNIRSLGPAGAVGDAPYMPYQEWLRQLEAAYTKATGGAA